MNQTEFIHKVNQYYADVRFIEIDTSPDFQCEQSGGFPVSLEVCWKKEKAWLMPNRSHFLELENENPDHAKEVMQCCADFGIRDCRSVFDYNNLLRELGKEALENAELSELDEGQNMGGI